MSGKIFYRERRKIGKGEKKPRFTVAAVFNTDIQFTAEHFKLSELEHIAKSTGAELIHLDAVKEGKKYKEKD